MEPKTQRQPLRRREDYPHFHIVPTRWEDNDSYGHINNIVYYSYIDTSVNRYLIDTGFLDFANGEIIGLAVETSCRFARPMSFPDPIAVGIRVARIGNSSVHYEVGLFAGDATEASAEGHYIHVYVERETMRPVTLPDQLRAILEPLRVPGSSV